MVHRILLAMLACNAAASADAAPVAITLRGPDGAPLADAVVMLDVARGPKPLPAGPYVMEQKGIQFRPHVLVVPVGASVAFPNRDQVRHHVYSFSKPKKFDLRLYGQQEERSVVFDQPGIVAIGCNIHDSMSAFIVVSATPFVGKTDSSGRALLDAPAGAATLRIWSPAIRASGNMLAQAITVGPNGYTNALSVRR